MLGTDTSQRLQVCTSFIFVAATVRFASPRAMKSTRPASSTMSDEDRPSTYLHGGLHFRQPAGGKGTGSGRDRRTESYREIEKERERERERERENKTNKELRMNVHANVR